MSEPSPWERLIIEQSQRIAELEAELASHRIAKDAKNPAGYRVVPGRLYDEAVARAVKAEAEVERLRKVLLHVGTHFSWQEECMQHYPGCPATPEASP